MNLPEIVREVSARSGIRQSDVSDILRTFCTVTTETILKGGTVALPNFGKFGTTEPKEREYRDPRTGDKIKRTVSRVTFTASKTIKDELRKK